LICRCLHRTSQVLRASRLEVSLVGRLPPRGPQPSFTRKVGEGVQLCHRIHASLIGP
jgi:hypothetical protein